MWIQPQEIAKMQLPQMCKTSATFTNNNNCLDRTDRQEDPVIQAWKVQQDDDEEMEAAVEFLRDAMEASPSWVSCLKNPTGGCQQGVCSPQ